MTAADADDAKVDAEWRRIEQERIAREIAEAGEDVEPSAEPGRQRHGLPTWQLIAMAAALIGGVAAALFLNRPLPSPMQPTPSHDRSAP